MAPYAGKLVVVGGRIPPGAWDGEVSGGEPSLLEFGLLGFEDLSHSMGYCSISH